MNELIVKISGTHSNIGNIHVVLVVFEWQTSLREDYKFMFRQANRFLLYKITC